MEVLADAPNQSNNLYYPLREFPVDGVVSQEEGEVVVVVGEVVDLATEVDSAAVVAADLEAAAAALETGVVDLETEAVSGTGVVSGVEVEVAFEVDVTMATGVVEAGALVTTEVDLAVMLLLMASALQVLKLLVVPVALALLHNKGMDHQGAASVQVEVDSVEISNVKDLVGTMIGTPSDRDISCGWVRYVQFFFGSLVLLASSPMTLR